MHNCGVCNYYFSWHFSRSSVLLRPAPRHTCNMNHNLEYHHGTTSRQGLPFVRASCVAWRPRFFRAENVGPTASRAWRPGRALAAAAQVGEVGEADVRATASSTSSASSASSRRATPGLRHALGERFRSAAPRSAGGAMPAWPAAATPLPRCSQPRYALEFPYR